MWDLDQCGTTKEGDFRVPQRGHGTAPESRVGCVVLRVWDGEDRSSGRPTYHSVDEISGTRATVGRTYSRGTGHRIRPGTCGDRGRTRVTPS